eukprot:TRINITY_DN8377_c0_g1_i3.p1 TRINITY_DN8377_c0_g1~~TRINITY_DN8377_c0_g1_i3.p1  ORF type:complete len:739 (+),score=115.15 TRINITY_DN8377_c0_g1_i3:57-2219(+)
MSTWMSSILDGINGVSAACDAHAIEAPKRFIGIEGATCLKLEITGRLPEISTPGHYRDARKLLQDLGGADALREELVYSGFVDPNTSHLNSGDKPFNVFAKYGSGTLTQPSSVVDQNALGEFKREFVVCANRLDNDVHWDSQDPLWTKKASMARRHKFLTTKNLHWQWFNALVFGLVPDDDGGVDARAALAEAEKMKRAALTYARNSGWSDQVGLFVNVFGHNNMNSLFVHILDMDELGPAFSYHAFKNLPFDAVIKVLREEAAASMLPAPVMKSDLPGLLAKSGARQRRTTMFGSSTPGAFFFAGTDGATSVKAELSGRVPVIKDAASFRGARRLVQEELGGVNTLREELRRSGFINQVSDQLTTGTNPFNVFARIAAGVMQQPGMEKEQEYLGSFSEQFLICSNRPENDEHWDSSDKEWIGKASMSKRHRFLTTKDLHWQWFNALVFGLVPEIKGGAGLGKAVAMVELMKAAALEFTKNAPGWSQKTGLFFHVFGLNSVNSLHLHILDMEELGPTFWHYEFKNCPLDVVLKVLKEEVSASSPNEASLSLLVDATAAATDAAKAAKLAAETMTKKASSIQENCDLTGIMSLNVGGEVVSVNRSTMMLAPTGSLLRAMFEPQSTYLSNEDENSRPFVDMPPAAFKMIVDHLRLIQLTPAGYYVDPLRVSQPDTRRTVEHLAWVLGVDDLVLRRAQAGMSKRQDILSKRWRWFSLFSCASA